MKNSNTYFKNKIILITGGGSGLGKALAGYLAGRGGRIYILEIDRQTGKDAVEEMVALKGEVVFKKTDVTDHSSFSKVVSKIYRDHGRIDILINNAGMSITGEVRDFSLSHWKKTIDLNLMGVMNGISILYPVMVKQGSGQIVNIASMAGLAPIPLVAPYVASKFGVVGLSEVLRIEAATLGIRINTVCPGRLATRIIDTSEIVNADREKFMKKVPFKALDLGKAARIIASGMKNNKRMIVFPWYVKWLWFIYRVAPFVLTPFYKYSLNQFREIRG